MCVVIAQRKISESEEGEDGSVEAFWGESGAQDQIVEVEKRV